MKHLSRRAERWLTFGALLSLSCGAFAAPIIAPATAQTSSAIAPSATLQADHRVLDASGAVVLTLNNSAFNTTRFRIGVFRVGQTARLAEVRRDFAVQNGALRTQIILDAPPGDYELRLLSDDKARTIISTSALVTVAGVRREPGWWLFNGQPFVARDNGTSTVSSPNASTSSASTSGAPLFIAGLKRDFGKNSKPISRTIQSNTLLQYRVLELPPLSEIAATNYDFMALRLKILNQIKEARTNGQRNLAGFETSANRSFPTLRQGGVANVARQLRQILNEVAPDAAIILTIDATYENFQPALFEDVAPLFDAVVLKTEGSDEVDLWPLKMLRRTAEEQSNYDLPIFVQSLWSRKEGLLENDPGADSAQPFELLMSGATGFIDNSFEYSNGVSSSWQNMVRRNLALFVGSVTLEDIGVLALPSRTAVSFNLDRGTHVIRAEDEALFKDLRNAGRIPQASRLPDLTQKESERKYESLMVSLGDRISNDTVERLRAAAKAGARIFIEGAPTRDENGKETAWRLGSLVGGDIKTVDSRNTAMTLEDGWMFGTQRGQKLQVAQNVVVTLNNETVAARAKVEKGVDVLTKPRAAAVLDDGSPALVINPVGKGEVIWMPHRVLDSSPAMRRQFYAALSNYIEPSLITLRATNRTTDAGAVHTALRRSPKGALLLGLFNDSNRPVSVSATIQGAAGVALDLSRERELPLQTRGNESEVSVSVPANGWTLIAFAIDRKTLDNERGATAGKVRLK
jgi:hypothetical protein